MAMQTGVATSKVLVLVGAGLTGSVLLKSGRLSDIMSELQVRRLAQEVRQLAAARPITFLNGNSGQSGNLASLVIPVAALGAMGYCYMWWKDFPAKARLERPAPTFAEAKSLKGLQYIADTIQSGDIEKTKVNAVLQNDIDSSPTEPTQIHRSFTTGISMSRIISIGDRYKS